MTRLWRILLCCILAFGLASCATPQLSRIDQHRDIYEGWSLEVRELVVEGQVRLGMSRDMVYLSWGRPTYIRVSSMVHDEIWAYEGVGDGAKVEKVVVFRAGQVMGLETR